MNLYKDLFTRDLQKSMGIYNMTDEFFALYLNYISQEYKNNILVVVNSLAEANNLYNRLNVYHEKTFLFPMDDFLTSEAIAASPDLLVKRLDTMNNIIDKKESIVITNLMGYLRFLPTVDNYKKSIIKLKKGEVYSQEELVNKLVSLGYVRDTIVNKTGEFAKRGYIVDVFPLDETDPIRIEFFDDEIDSIRSFNPETQKSLKRIDEINIYPNSEFITEKKVAEEHFQKQKYYPIYEEINNIMAYLGNDVFTFYKDYSQLQISFDSTLDIINEYNQEKDDTFNGKYMYLLDDLSPINPIYYNSLDNLSSNNLEKNEINYDVKNVPNFGENIELINDYLYKSLNNKKTIIICLKEYQIKSILKKLKMKLYETTFDKIKEACINIVNLPITEGFIYKNYIVISANELFKIKEKKRNYNNKFKYASPISDINKLSVGDYVVHNTHGIGIYNGIKTLTLNNISKDYLEVLYQGTDKIYIPVEKINLLSKFSGRDGYTPKINKLGSIEWEKTKARVRKKITDMAEQLLKLYAEREQKKGFAFSKDCDMLLDFEHDFPYDLTADQKKAIIQIKEDMESTIPMDRLLCGDVGFGKTEVAFVAAFKAMLDSKQVFFLCPTTILSSQHYENAIERFKNYPVSIALLNRFSSPKEVSKIKQGLLEGTIDMVIGTHRLLSDDIKAKDLGLLIIDEEQRFGVVHKEKIKQYKSTIDVLTLTATPIPRTLQMSLVGIRSLSLIETPPINRYPVQTYVVEENKQILKEAITKEMARKGQIYILYNRVQYIDSFANKIQNIVPDARIGIAHGQLTKTALENTIYDFINYEYDILICTTIIETGIDISNVNTLIIMDADRFGLSQLYQIRGRVGRSDKFAYAYLMYQPFKSLTETAMKRLNAIKEFTELGSGFSIATRDLSIRGAGDILGSEQAGFIDSVGVDLYLKMLNEEVNHLSVDNEEPEEGKALIDVTTHIDDNYVDEDVLKIEIHQKINTISDEASYNLVKEELEDRFGKLSDDMLLYMHEEWLESLFSQLGIKKVRQSKNSIEIFFPEEVVEKIDVEELFVDAFNITKMFRFISRGSHFSIVLDIIKLEKHPVYYLIELLTKVNLKVNKSID